MVVSMMKSREEQSILPSGYQLCQETDMIICTEISSIFFSLLKNNILEHTKSKIGYSICVLL